jgi:outer membrane protein TolC
MPSHLRSYLSGITLALLTLSGAQASEALPGAKLPELLALAEERNPDYASMRAEADAALERVDPAAALPDPKLRVELMDITKGGEQNPTLLPNEVGSTRYTWMQDVPWFGKRALKREIAALDHEGARARAELNWSELSARIKSAYAQSYYLHQSERLASEILDLMSQLERLAQARYAGGLAAQQDVIRAQLEQGSMKNELIALEHEQHMVRSRLNTLLARPAEAALATPEDLRPLPPPGQLDFNVLQARVRERNPQLFAENTRVKSAEKSRELSIKNRFPDFNVSISPTQTGGAIKEWGLMVELNIPLQQSARRAQEREAQAMLSAAELRKEATANQVLGDLAENLATLETAQRTEATATNMLLPLAELNFKAALANYESTKLDFATLLEAQRQIRQARQNQIKAQLDAQLRLADIEKLLGEDL